MVKSFRFPKYSGNGHSRTPTDWQIFGAGGAIIQKKNKEKEKGKGKELVTHFTPFMHKLAVQSILAVRVGAQAVGCI